MIFNINSGPVRKTPVLDSAYPKNVTVDVGASATFQVVIAEDGKPAEYTYQWYYDGTAVSGATKSTYSRTAVKGSHTVYCMVTSKAGSVKSRSATLKAETLYLYNSGTFNTAVAGDLAQIGLNLWQGNTAATHKPGTCTIKKNASNFTVSSYGALCAAAYFNKKIDLTNYNTLYFEGKMVENSGHTAYIGVWTSFDKNGSNLNRPAVLDGPVSNGTHTLDISAVNTSCYIGFLVSGGTDGAVTTVNKVYLK